MKKPSGNWVANKWAKLESKECRRSVTETRGRRVENDKAMKKHTVTALRPRRPADRRPYVLVRVETGVAVIKTLNDGKVILSIGEHSITSLTLHRTANRRHLRRYLANFHGRGHWEGNVRSFFAGTIAARFNGAPQRITRAEAETLLRLNIV